MDFTKDDLNNLRVFLSRVTLEGKEALIHVLLDQKIQAAINKMDAPTTKEPVEKTPESK